MFRVERHDPSFRDFAVGDETARRVLSIRGHVVIGDYPGERFPRPIELTCLTSSDQSLLETDAPVPEPASMLLGVAALLAGLRRTRQRSA